MSRKPLKNPDGSPHVHCYQRVRETDKTKPIRYFCTHPDCTNAILRDLIAGKRTICSICKVTETFMDYENMRRERPRCINCSATEAAKGIREKRDILEALFEGKQ